jgi:hypothetical protein
MPGSSLSINWIANLRSVFPVASTMRIDYSLTLTSILYLRNREILGSRSVYPAYIKYSNVEVWKTAIRQVFPLDVARGYTWIGVQV